MPTTPTQLEESFIRMKNHSSFDDPGMRASLRKIPPTINEDE